MGFERMGDAMYTQMEARLMGENAALRERVKVLEAAIKEYAEAKGDLSDVGPIGKTEDEWRQMRDRIRAAESALLRLSAEAGAEKGRP